MKTFRILATAAVLSAAGVAPALADWDRIGSVEVSFRQDRDRAYTEFGGGIERLQFRADDSSVNCRSVRATFDNGQTSQVFSGRLPLGQAVTVDLPGRSRVVRRLDFSCHADRPRGATVNILADVGRYRDDWRHSPNWTRTWSRMFNWGNNGPVADPMANWVMLGNESFQGRGDSASTFSGWRGRSVDMLALRPAGADARCTRLRVTFDNGRTRDLDVNDRMVNGRMYKFDLPGDQRNVSRLDLNCHPLNRDQVNIEIYARK